MGNLKTTLGEKVGYDFGGYQWTVASDELDSGGRGTLHTDYQITKRLPDTKSRTR